MIPFLNTIMIKKLFFYPALIFLFACSSQEETIPEGILEEGTMVSILTSVHIEENYIKQQNIAADTAIAVFHVRKNAIFEKYHTDSTTFNKSFDYYLQHPKKIDAIYAAVTDSLGLKQSLKKMD